MLLISDANHYDYMSPSLHEIRRGNTIVRVSDNGVEGAGVAGSATVFGGGGMGNKYGACWGVVGTSNPTTGKYIVYHTLNRATYKAMIEPMPASGSPTHRIANKTATSFEVYLYNNGSPANMDFEVVIYD